MTGYGTDEFKREVDKKKREEAERKAWDNRPCKCPVCGELLNDPDEYHNDGCDIVKGFVAWSKEREKGDKKNA